MPKLRLPKADGSIEEYECTGTPLHASRGPHAFNRIAYAAAHVIANPLADNNPCLDEDVDWERTIAFREYLWDLGLGVAEAMDTAQRGSGLSWKTAQELIRRSLEVARGREGALIACGVGTDQIQLGCATIDDVVRAYEEQAEFVETNGGRIILMASRALAALARSSDDYLRVYERILRQTKEPVILHWLGEMFDPALAGYWGSRDDMAAMETCLDLIRTHSNKIDGIKISLLSAEKEIAMRRSLPAGVRMYTGDDFNYAELIAGDDKGHSDALLGIFDAIAPASSAALTKLAQGDESGFHAVLAPTVPLSRHIFKPPTRFYKTGVVFLAYLNGFQDHFTMLGGQQSARSLVHLAEIFRLADQCGMLRDPEMAATRIRWVLTVGGVV